ncbi:MAG: hypothetical protein GIW97_01945 [Candidatus Eremiobacteraeota bacterium]|nr:hypothetical protein [Candidatus Eremiobacteraeota bacterium]
MMIAAALAVALASGPQVERWVDANRQSSGRIHNAKERKARERIFAQSERDFVKMQAAAPPRTGANAARTAQSILSNHRLYRFGEVQKAAPKTWWDRLTEWTAARWRAIVNALFKNVHVSRAASVAFGDILLASAIAAFLFFVVRLAWHYGRRTSGTSFEQNQVAFANPSALYAQAERAAQSGRYGESVTTIFAAALCALQRRGLAVGEQSKTVGELRRRVHRSEFDVLARAVTMAVYADAAVGPQDWEHARDAYRSLVSGGEADDAA